RRRALRDLIDHVAAVAPQLFQNAVEFFGIRERLVPLAGPRPAHAGRMDTEGLQPEEAGFGVGSRVEDVVRHLLLPVRNALVTASGHLRRVREDIHPERDRPRSEYPAAAHVLFEPD